MPHASKAPSSQQPGRHAAEAIMAATGTSLTLLYEALTTYGYMKKSADERKCAPTAALPRHKNRGKQ